MECQRCCPASFVGAPQHGHSCSHHIVIPALSWSDQMGGPAHEILLFLGSKMMQINLTTHWRLPGDLFWVWKSP